MNPGDAELASLSPEVRRSFLAARARLLGGDPRTALAHAQVLVQGNPQFASGWHLVGVSALQAGKLSLALDALERGARLAPGDAELANNLAAAYLRAGRYGDAERAAQSSQRLAPQRAGPLLNRATALQALGRLDEAVDSAERALQIDRANAEAWNNLGNLYKEQGRYADALTAYEMALDQNPGMREALSNKLAALKLDPAQDWRSLFEAHRSYARRFENPALAGYVPLSRDDSATRRLKVGYVSPDCHGAVPAFIRPVLRAHDPEQFEIFCYFNNAQPRESDPEIAARVTARVMRGLSDAQVAAQIRADEIDLLIDIAGHTGRNRLGVFMLRPAPIQISWLDYLGTTGLYSMDYRLTDAVADPPGEADLGHTEALLRLPHPQWCWEPPGDAPGVEPPPGQTTEWLTLGSFNNYSKLTEATLELWARILQTVSMTRLLIVGAAEGAARARIERALQVARERLAFLPRLSPQQYRQAFGKVDLALDPLPFSGATTTLDALWQGVPVLTLPGRSSASRSTASIELALGLDRFVARDADEYLAQVARIAQGRAELAELRAALRERLRASSLTDAPRFTRQLEAQLREVWRAWCEASPRPFSVAPEPGQGTPAPRWRQADLALKRARDKVVAGALDEGIGELIELLAEHQNWTLAQQLLASAVLKWARQHAQCLDQLLPPVTAPVSPPKVSIIMCSVDEAKLAAARASYHQSFAGLPHEIIAITDARSLSEGFNRGARQASGDILVFSHDDVLVLGEDFALRMLAHLSRWDGVGVCGSSRLVSANWGHAAQPDLHGHVIHQPPGETGLILLAAGCAAPVQEAEALDGVFTAVRREVWERSPFDEQRFDGFHLYDLDFCFRATRAGFRFGIPLDLSLLHRSTGSYGAEWHKYARRFEDKFSGQLAAPRGAIAGSIHCRLKSFEEVRLLLAGLLHFRYGAAPSPRDQGGQR